MSDLAPPTLPKRFDPGPAEARWYREWLARGVFRADPDDPRPPFSMVIPPPNVTGSLHLGHALNNTLQDLLCRHQRLEGRSVLWLPGTDHAGISTQVVVEREIAKEGMTRHDLGREAFVDRIWEWKARYGARIVEQLQALGVVLRLEPGALHPRPGALARRPRGLRPALPRGLDLSLRIPGLLVPALQHRALRPREPLPAGGRKLCTASGTS